MHELTSCDNDLSHTAFTIVFRTIDLRCTCPVVRAKYFIDRHELSVKLVFHSTNFFFRLASSLLQQSVSSKASEEIQTSIKEVTSAIVHYVSGLEPANGDLDTTPSPRSSQKLYWLESSFVGKCL